jgi:DNA-binding transcriptional LysR family regulator
MRHVLPRVTVELVVSNSVSNLLLREADIALRMVRPEQGSLVARQIGQVRVRAFASNDYLLRRGTPQVLEDLVQHDLIAGDTNTEIQQGFEAMGFPASTLHFGLRTDDMNVQWAAVRAGLGIGFMGEYPLESDPSITALLPMNTLPGLPVWLTVHRELRTSARIRAVYDFLADEVGQALQKNEAI